MYLARTALQHAYVMNHNQDKLLNFRFVRVRYGLLNCPIRVLVRTEKYNTINQLIKVCSDPLCFLLIIKLTFVLLKKHFDFLCISFP